MIHFPFKGKASSKILNQSSKYQITYGLLKVLSWSLYIWRWRIFIVLLFLMDLLQSLMLFTVHLQVSNESRGTFHFLLFFDKCSLKIHRKLNSNQYVNHFVRDSFCISINEFRDKDFKNAKNGIFSGSRSIKAYTTKPKTAWKSCIKISCSLEI